MTMVALEPVAAKQRLGDATLVRGLLRMLRRRVPAVEVEDLAQTVLCDALAAPSVPIERRDLERWLVGIARHKVADYHRRARRWTEEGPEPAAAPAPFEEREILGQVLEGAASAERDRETLGWLVREHEGERLADIAKEEGLAPTAVRQRASRMRRALRSRWTGALLVLLAVGALGAGAAGTGPREAIVAEPTAELARVLSGVQGEWRIERLDLAPDALEALTPAERALVEARGELRVRVQGARIEVVGAAGGVERAFGLVERGGALTLVGPGGKGAARVRVQRHGDTLALEVLDGRLRGRALLRTP